MELFLKLITILAPLMLVLVFSMLAYKKNNNKFSLNKTLRIPYLYRILSIAVFVFCFSISLYILIFQFEDWPYIIILGFVGVSFLAMYVMCSLWKVKIKDDGFIYINYFGKKVEYKYNELRYEQHPKGLKWFFYKDDKKVLCIAYYIENGDVLYKRYKKVIRKSGLYRDIDNVNE